MNTGKFFSHSILRFPALPEKLSLEHEIKLMVLGAIKRGGRIRVS